MKPKGTPKTVNSTPFGLFEYTRKPFVLRNAAQTFQCFINYVTRDLPFVYAYIDDLLVVIRTLQEHEHHLMLLFKHLNYRLWTGVNVNK